MTGVNHAANPNKFSTVLNVAIIAYLQQSVSIII